jgi:Pentapeptide repeats (9 copies)
MFDFGILPFQLAKDWLGRLYGDLTKISAERKGEIDQIANTFGDPAELAKHYIEPDCQQFNPADSDNEEAYHIVREPLFDKIETFLSGDGNRQGRQLFVLSDAGMGKTSFLVMLKLAHVLSFWPKGYDCVLLKLGKDTLEAIRRIKSQRDTVLLLDALDEDPIAWDNRSSRVAEILAATKNFRRTVITCRTQFLSGERDPFQLRGRLQIEGHLCPVLYNALFTDRQVVKYLTKRYPNEVQSEAWQARVTNIIRSMGVLKMRPMLLAYIEDLVASPETQWNEFTIYRALVEVWLHRERQKIALTEGKSPSATELLDACRYMAVLIFNKDRRYLTAEEMAVRSAVLAMRVSSMQLGVRSLLTKDSAGNYRFSHYSILEYLVVECVVADRFLNLLTWSKPTSLMPVFAAGWLKNGNFNHPRLRALERIGLAGTDFSAFDLGNIDISGFDCRAANFSSVRMNGARLVGADLEEASFYDATLHDVDFTGARLRSASFTFATVSRASFLRSDLEGADFTSAIVEECKFDRGALAAKGLVRRDAGETDA